jgi:hypothetical protein
MGLRSQLTRRRWLVSALIVALLAGGAGTALALHSSGAPSAITLRYPREVVKSIDAVALGQTSVRWTENGGSSESDNTFGIGPTGKTGPTAGYTGPHWRSTSDVTADSGVQRITISLRHGTGEAELRLAGNLVYVKGNALALEWMALGLTHAQALRYAGRWISIPKGHDPLTDVPEHLTLAKLVNDEANPAWLYGGFRHLPDYVYLTAIRKSDGTLGVDWEDDGSDAWSPTSNLSARAGGEPLPIAATSEGSGDEAGHYSSASSSGRFSRWNEPVHVTVPKHAVPIATVRGR